MSRPRVPEQMMAVVLDQFGPPSALHYRAVPVPRPGPDEVTIEVHAVSINRTLDLAVRRDGDRRPVSLPLVLGADPSGVVAECGSTVSAFAPGEHVAVLPIRCKRCVACLEGRDCTEMFQLGVERWGGYAQYVTVPAWSLVRLPSALDFASATVLVRHYPIAHHLLANVARVAPGESVLVLGSAGGLGSAGVEVARLLGARVMAGAGADERVAAAVELGATWGVNYREHDLEREVDRLTEGRGVDVLFENVADPTLWPAAFRSLGRGGRLVTAGSHGGGIVPLDVRRLYQRRLSILGAGGRSERDVEWVLEQAAAGRLHPLIGAVLPLEEAAQAHELVEQNAIIGKVILTPAHP